MGIFFDMTKAKSVEYALENPSEDRALAGLLLTVHIFLKHLPIQFIEGQIVVLPAMELLQAVHSESGPREVLGMRALHYW